MPALGLAERRVRVVIVSIHQPGYLPWHGFFHRLALSQLHIFFDTTQFEKHGFNNRVKIRTAQGEQWLTVPVLVKGRFGNNPIRDAELNPSIHWEKNHWKTLTMAYGRAPHFQDYAPFFSRLYETRWTHLAPLNIHALEHLASVLEIGCRFIRASELSVSGQKSELVMNLCRAVGATTYLSGINGREYLDKETFRRAGITLRFQAYREPQYRQLQGGFSSYMSVVDLLFNHGPASREILTAGQDSLLTGSLAE